MSVIDYLQANIYDFLHGALGIVFYFLSENNEKADNYVLEFMDEFEKKSKKTIKFAFSSKAVKHFLGYHCHLAM